VRVTRATDFAHHACSLWLAQIRARGELLEGSRHGRGRRADSGWVRRGGEGPGCRGAAGAERVSEAESGARKGTTLTCGAIGSARAERESAALLAWAGASGWPRREREKGKKRLAQRERARHCWLGPGQAEGRPSVGKGKQRERRWPAGWAIGPARAGFLLSFSFLFSNSNSNLFNSNKFESNPNHTIK
jgi:hypothetical protein